MRNALQTGDGEPLKRSGAERARHESPVDATVEDLCFLQSPSSGSPGMNGGRSVFFSPLPIESLLPILRRFDPRAAAVDVLMNRIVSESAPDLNPSRAKDNERKRKAADQTIEEALTFEARGILAAQEGDHTSAQTLLQAAEERFQDGFVSLFLERGALSSRARHACGSIERLHDRATRAAKRVELLRSELSHAPFPTEEPPRILTIAEAEAAQLNSALEAADQFQKKGLRAEALSHYLELVHNSSLSRSVEIAAKKYFEKARVIGEKEDSLAEPSQDKQGVKRASQAPSGDDSLLVKLIHPACASLTTRREALEQMRSLAAEGQERVIHTALRRAGLIYSVDPETGLSIPHEQQIPFALKIFAQPLGAEGHSLRVKIGLDIWRSNLEFHLPHLIGLNDNASDWDRYHSAVYFAEVSGLKVEAAYVSKHFRLVHRPGIPYLHFVSDELIPPREQKAASDPTWGQKSIFGFENSPVPMIIVSKAQSAHDVLNTEQHEKAHVAVEALWQDLEPTPIEFKLLDELSARLAHDDLETMDQFIELSRKLHLCYLDDFLTDRSKRELPTAQRDSDASVRTQDSRHQSSRSLGYRVPYFEPHIDETPRGPKEISPRLAAVRNDLVQVAKEIVPLGNSFVWPRFVNLMYSLALFIGRTGEEGREEARRIILGTKSIEDSTTELNLRLEKTSNQGKKETRFDDFDHRVRVAIAFPPPRKLPNIWKE